MYNYNNQDNVKADVTASDKEDGDITANLEVVKNEVDTTKAGVYEVTYKVTDSQGASYTTTIQVTVNPKMETLNEAPIITATDKTITVGDTFDPKVYVSFLYWLLFFRFQFHLSSAC